MRPQFDENGNVVSGHSNGLNGTVAESTARGTETDTVLKYSSENTIKKSQK